MSDFHFETQRRTYNSYGYAVDPTTGASADSIVGDVEAAARNNCNIRIISQIESFN